MALRVPLTRRDFFFEDPFFADVWQDFERLRRDIWSGHGSFLKNGDFWPTSKFSSIFPEKRWFYPQNFFDDDDFKLTIPQLKDEILQGNFFLYFWTKNTLKIKQNVSIEFWHFPTIFVLLKLTCLVTLFDIAKLTIFDIFSELLSSQNVKARFARNVVKWDFSEIFNHRAKMRL